MKRSRKNSWLDKWDAAKNIPLSEEQLLSPIVQELKRHVTQKTGLVIDYIESDATLLERIVVYPESIFCKSGYPHVYFSAFSKFHNEVRNFRVDRIKKHERINGNAHTPVTKNQSQPPASKCFIATCVYDSEESWEVLELRRFRDTILNRSTMGRTSIRLYESVGPYLASLIGCNNVAMRLTRLVFSQIVIPFVGLLGSFYKKNNSDN